MSVDSTPPIEIKDLKKTFRVGFFRKKVEAVRQISFSVHKNEIVGLVGPNGAGKTTTMKIITGLVRADEGTAKLFGQTADKVESRARLGYLPENPYFYEHLTVPELLRFYGNLFGLHGEELRERSNRLVERVGLGHAIDRPIKKFSKGMRQRAGLAQALINDPDLVILDEPQTGLDPVGRREVRDLIFELKEEGKTILFSSHILPDVEAVCDRVVLIHKGENRETGTLAELTGDRVLSVELVVNADSVEQIQALSGHLRIQERGGSFVVRFPGDFAINSILEDALANGLDVVSIHREREDLENVFVRDTYGASDDEFGEEE